MRGCGRRCSRVPVAGYLGCCAALRDADLQAEAGRVAAPTLVVTGTQDVATPPAAGVWLAGTIPGARLVSSMPRTCRTSSAPPAFTDAPCARRI